MDIGGEVDKNPPHRYCRNNISGYFLFYVKIQLKGLVGSDEP